MARKLDAEPAPTALPLRLPYESDLATSLVRVITVWTASEFQASVVAAAPGSEPLPAAADIPVVYLLAAAGPQRPGRLAALLGSTPSAISRSAERLAAEGLAHRSPDPDDARASLLALTPLGARAAERMFRAGDLLMTQLLSGWSRADRDRLTALLHRFADAVADRAAAGDDTAPIGA